MFVVFTTSYIIVAFVPKNESPNYSPVVMKFPYEQKKLVFDRGG